MSGPGCSSIWQRLVRRSCSASAPVTGQKLVRTMSCWPSSPRYTAPARQGTPVHGFLQPPPLVHLLIEMQPPPLGQMPVKMHPPPMLHLMEEMHRVPLGNLPVKVHPPPLRHLLV